MTAERRTAERVRISLPARWEGAFAARDGEVVDISTTGCFILSDDAVYPGELIRLEVVLPTGRTLRAWAEVVYQFPEAGFAVRFAAFDRAERGMVEALIDFSRRSNAAT